MATFYLMRESLRNYQNKALHAWIARWIYQDVPIYKLFTMQLVFGLVAFALQLPFSIRKDIRRIKDLRYGRRLKGPVLVNGKQFTKAVAGNGIGITTNDSKLPLRIPRDAENKHFLIVGDTGSGKSSVIRQMLYQVEARGDSAIVYDPACEFVKQFYNPHRGDIVLNPLDARMPYWNPSKELRRKAEAKALAVSLYQPEGVSNRFFVEAPQKIFAHLLTYLPTPEDLVKWMSDPAEIDRRVKGTEYWMLIDPKAPQQRTGVLGSLNMSADSFRLLPKEDETSSAWTATQWAESRRGWIFITSRPTMREALRPLISLWIDTLVLRLLNEPMPDQKPVWFVIDELASLQRLPQLHTAITENRKSQNPVILGFQGRSQMEARYGQDAEAMLSQPATKIFLRTTEPRAAKWVSEAIGEVEIERLRETHYDGSRAGKNFALDRQTEPLVLPSEVSGLDDLRGFLKYGNHVARFSFPFIALREKNPGFDERKMDDLIIPSTPLPPEPEEMQGNLLGTGTRCPTVRAPGGVIAHAYHFKATVRRPGTDLSPEGIHGEGAELLVTTGCDRRRVARAVSLHSSALPVRFPLRILESSARGSTRRQANNLFDSERPTSTRMPTERPSRQWSIGPDGTLPFPLQSLFR